MQKFFILAGTLFFFSSSSAQWSLGGEYKFHPKENQVGLRYDGLSNLNSNFNLGIHYAFGAKSSWGLSVGYNYHFDNTFQSSLTAGANVGLNFSTGANDKKTSLDLSGNLGYYGLLGDMKHGLVWPKAYANYRLDLGEQKEENKGQEDEPNAFTLRPALHVGYRF